MPDENIVAAAWDKSAVKNQTDGLRDGAIKQLVDANTDVAFHEGMLAGVELAKNTPFFHGKNLRKMAKVEYLKALVRGTVMIEEETETK